MRQESRGESYPLAYLVVTLLVVILAGAALALWQDKAGEVLRTAWEFLLKQ